MNNIYNNILNKNNGQQIYTGTVITLAPLTVKIFAADDAISVVPTSNLAGLAVGDKVIFSKIGAQFFAIGYVGSPKIDAMTIIKTTEQAITTTDATKIAFDGEYGQSGSNLTFDSNGIKIGDGIKMVSVNCQAWFVCNDTNAYSALFIYKNASVYAYGILPKRVNNDSSYQSDTWRTVNVNALIEVTKDDYIYGYAKFSDADAGNKIDDATRAGQLTVTAVEYDFS